MRPKFIPRPKIVPKPWGREEWLIVTPKYCAKFLVIQKGRRCSLQYHRKKHETLYAWKGRWKLTWAGRAGRGPRRFRTRWMRPGQAVILPPGAVHRMEAGPRTATILEVSTPHLSDVVRLADDYNRIP